jgi:hypothetical protein
VQKLCSFMQFHSSILSLSFWAIQMLFRKIPPMPIYPSSFTICSSVRSLLESELWS